MTAYFTHPAFREHEMGPHHPERPERLSIIHDHLTRKGLMPLLDLVEPTESSDESILRVHTQEHLDRLTASSPRGKRYQAIDPDTAMNPHTLYAAYLAAGAAVQATDAVVCGKTNNAFCAVRPPGHHAERNSAMGFCFFNNIAIAVAHALEVHGLSRVVVVDFDVHHGNGTEEIFANDDRVLMISTFEQSIYPFRGDVPLGPNMVNVPLAAYSNGSALKEAVLRHWLPALAEFKPQMMFISAGFDAHREDQLSHLLWVDDDYAWVTEELAKAANTWCDGRIVSMLEGGYALEALGRSVGRHVDVLMTA